MKKIYYLAGAALLLAACSGKNETSVIENSEGTAVEEVAVATDTASQDSMVVEGVSDTVVVEENDQAKPEKKKASESEYGKLISQYESAVNKWDSYGKKEDWDTQEKYRVKVNNLFDKIEKIKGKLSPEELKRYKKIERKAYRLADKWQ